ncbi:hypothetical protein AB434_1819 [Heyndrickxia coagulans]|uniref:Uncharacterized protein n=1 Tax=Heyndrickxia coagulans TaxID=1398 RepID=A0AAN0T9Y3_HEYCO|nr:hypothetical protein SB48_HM08orf05606 [Heyndrickxia coagulans]AKN54224.1 hypothetical protein AB434_1819 [Heyndrickxia coagulans]KYC85456.1 hypothetical protein B4096_0751 [Heyndrickxia coagulans]
MRSRGKRQNSSGGGHFSNQHAGEPAPGRGGRMTRPPGT